MEENLKSTARKNWKDSFIISYNDFFNHKNEKLFMDSDQLYIYATLSSLERLNGSIVTNISVIEECLPALYSENPNYNRRKIKEVLTSLEKQRIIETNKEKIESLRVNEPIVIYIDYEYIDEHKITEGFEQVSFEEFYQSESSMDFYIRCCVIRYDENPLNKKKSKSYAKGFSCSYEEWGRILGRTERNAIKIINEALERKVIHVNIGNYISDNSQSINTYRLNPIKEEEKTLATKNKESNCGKDESNSGGDKSDSPF